MAEILLVDNDARITELIAWFLSRRGHAVRTVASFSLARECILERMPDLMLSDVDLGSENGREELPEMAREGLLPPTLVVSGYLDCALDARLSAIPGILGTLSKPFDLATLEERVGACLAQHKEPRAPLPRAAPLAPIVPAHTAQLRDRTDARSDADRGRADTDRR